MQQNLIFTNDVLTAITRLTNDGDHNLTIWIADVNTARLINPAPPRLVIIPDGDGVKKYTDIGPIRQYVNDCKGIKS